MRNEPPAIVLPSSIPVLLICSETSDYVLLLLVAMAASPAKIETGETLTLSPIAAWSPVESGSSLIPKLMTWE